jgi:hypothetical protein
VVAAVAFVIAANLVGMPLFAGTVAFVTALGAVVLADLEGVSMDLALVAHVGEVELHVGDSAALFRGNVLVMDGLFLAVARLVLAHGVMVAREADNLGFQETGGAIGLGSASRNSLMIVGDEGLVGGLDNVLGHGELLWDGAVGLGSPAYPRYAGILI